MYGSVNGCRSQLWSVWLRIWGRDQSFSAIRHPGTSRRKHHLSTSFLGARAASHLRAASVPIPLMVIDAEKSPDASKCLLCTGRWDGSTLILPCFPYLTPHLSTPASWWGNMSQLELDGGNTTRTPDGTVPLSVTRRPGFYAQSARCRRHPIAGPDGYAVLCQTRDLIARSLGVERHSHDVYCDCQETTQGF